MTSSKHKVNKEKKGSNSINCLMALAILILAPFAVIGLIFTKIALDAFTGVSEDAKKAACIQTKLVEIWESKREMYKTPTDMPEEIQLQVMQRCDK